MSSSRLLWTWSSGPARSERIIIDLKRETINCFSFVLLVFVSNGNTCIVAKSGVVLRQQINESATSLLTLSTLFNFLFSFFLSFFLSFFISL